MMPDMVRMLTLTRLLSKPLVSGRHKLDTFEPYTVAYLRVPQLNS